MSKAKTKGAVFVPESYTVYTNDGDECGEVKKNGPVSECALFYPGSGMIALEPDELRSIADKLDEMGNGE